MYWECNPQFPIIIVRFGRISYICGPVHSNHYFTKNTISYHKSNTILLKWFVCDLFFIITNYSTHKVINIQEDEAIIVYRLTFVGGGVGEALVSAKGVWSFPCGALSGIDPVYRCLLEKWAWTAETTATCALSWVISPVCTRLCPSSAKRDAAERGPASEIGVPIAGTDPDVGRGIGERMEKTMERRETGNQSGPNRVTTIGTVRRGQEMGWGEAPRPSKETEEPQVYSRGDIRLDYAPLRPDRRVGLEEWSEYLAQWWSSQKMEVCWCFPGRPTESGGTAEARWRWWTSRRGRTVGGWWNESGFWEWSRRRSRPLRPHHRRSHLHLLRRLRSRLRLKTGARP